MGKKPKTYLKRNFFIFTAVWTLCICLLLYFTIIRERHYTVTLAEENAKYFTTMVKNIIEWVALHKGVYVLENSKTLPSIYFTKKESEFVSKQGKKFAFLDVSTFIREISQISKSSSNVLLKLTSLYPLNPKNKPSKWEVKALKIVKQTKKPYFEFDSKFFKYIYPLITSERCLSCHLHLNLKIGELRGGISVYIPSKKFLQIEKDSIKFSIIFYILLWLLGISLIIVFYYQNKKILYQAEETNKKFKIIFEQSNLPMLILDKGIIIDCNNAIINLFKAKEKKDIIGLSPSQLSPIIQYDGMYSSEKAANMIKNGLNKGITTFEWLHKTLSDEILWTVVTLTKFYRKNKSFIFATIQDITQIKELENKLRITLDSITEAVISTNTKEEITIFNPMAEKLTEFSVEESINKKFNQIIELYDLKSSKRIENLSTILKKKDMPYFKGKLISKTGKIHIVELSVSPIIFKEDRGFVLVCRDITEQEQIEQELAKIKTLERIGQLAGGLAHDFNNLLTGIFGNISLLKLKMQDDKFEKYFKRIENSLESAKDLTYKLLTFAKGGAPIRKVLSIKELLEEIPEFYVKGSKIKLRKVIPDNLWRANVDKGQVSQVISNLVINAIDAMEEGGVLTVSAENFKSYNNKSLPNGEYIKITIKDTGKGIDKKILDKIFDPFFTTKERGSGLGLSIVHSIIEKHNGKIFVNSIKGKGTIFTIYLPAFADDLYTTELHKKDFSKDFNKKNLKVLVMDDEKIVRETIKDILEFFDFTVDEAEDGDSALKRVKANNYDLVILDLTIPGGKGGKEIIKDILAINPNLKVIAVSGYSMERVLPEYKKYGFSGVLKKPFKIKEFRELVNKIFSS